MAKGVEPDPDDWEGVVNCHLLVAVGETAQNGERSLQMMLVDAR